MKRLLLVLFIICHILPTFSQPVKLRFEHLLDEEFNTPLPVRMAEDFQGNLWGFFNSTLTKFDGNNWTKYIHRPGDACSIPSLGRPQLSGILADSHKNLWISTTKGLIRLDLTSDCFTTFFTNWASFQVLGVCEDSSDNLWLLEATKGLIKISIQELVEKSEHPDALKYKVFPYPHLHNPGYSLTGSTQILPDNNGGLWLAGRYGLGHFDPKKEKFSIHQPSSDTSPSFNSSNNIQHIFKDSKGTLWLGTGNGLIRFDQIHKKLAVFYPYGKEGGDLKQNIIRAINEIADGRLIVGMGSGYLQQLKLFDPKTAQFISIDGNAYINQNTGQGYYEQMFKDRSGILWLVNTPFGLTKFNYENNQFVFYEINHRPNAIKGNFVRSVCPDRYDNLYIGTDTHLNYLNRTTGETSHFPTAKVANSSLNSADISAIVEDRSGMIWLGTTTGLSRFDPRTKITKQYLLPEKYATWVITLFEDREGMLWVGTQSPGKLLQFDRKRKKFILISGDINLWAAGVRSFAEDTSGNLWISSNAGLVLFDRKKNTFIKAPLNIPSRYVSGLHDILLDKNGKLWICAIDGPIFKYDLKSKKTYSYEHIAAFSNNLVRSIVMDEHGILWIASAKGMIQFDPDSERLIRLFSAKTWLQPGQIWYAPIMNSARIFNGEVVVQGRSGVLVFHPDRVRINTTPPNMVITGLRFPKENAKRKGKIPLSNLLSADKTIRLAHHENNFSIDFVGIHLKAPEANQYAYRLEPIEKTWQQVGTLRQAKYTRLNPGEYKFHVKASNSDGVWNEKGATLNIVITSPWWWNFWSKLLYLILFASIVVGVYRFQMTRQLAQVEVAKLRELGEFKSHLIANISHEFRTPLSNIIGTTKLWERNPEQWFQEGPLRIRRSSNVLLRLVDQMLGLSRLEAGILPLNLEQGDVIAHLKYLSKSVLSLADVRDIELLFISNLEEFYMDYDPEKWQVIISNLLSNALKFTPLGGKVYLEILPIQDNQFCFQVRDTGPGVADQDLPHLFDRFYQANTSSGGTGIGLAYARELIQLMGGRIEAKSLPGQGTRFIVHLPISRNAKFMFFKENEVNSLILTTNTNEEEDLPLLLIVEDNTDLSSYLQHTLKEGYRIIVASDGITGMEIALEKIPDIIISDVMMPRMDGFELCEALKSDLRTSHIPIVLLTARVDVASRIAGLKRGADAYLPKPVDETELQIQLITLLENRRRWMAKYVDSGFLAGQQNLAPSTVETALEDAFVTQARAIILAHLGDFYFDVPRFCQLMMVSRPQLHRKLKALTGLSATQFIRKIRIEEAKKLLASGKAPVYTIADQCGFQTVPNFNRVFQEMEMMTPTAYRNKVSAEG